MADLIGEICWLADDLFDLKEDIRDGRVNSLLYLWNLEKAEGNGGGKDAVVLS